MSTLPRHCIVLIHYYSLINLKHFMIVKCYLINIISKLLHGYTNIFQEKNCTKVVLQAFQCVINQLRLMSNV